MSFSLTSGDPGPELASMRESDSFVRTLQLKRREATKAPVFVRPLVGDEADAWMPVVHETIAVVNGVVAISASDVGDAAQIAANAAAWFGDRGRAIVLVDASIDRPVVGKPLPEDGDEGLVDAVLYGVSTTAVVRRTLASGVRVVTAGSHPISVESVFRDARFAAFLRELAEDELVLLVLPSVHLCAAADVLDAAVCIAGDSAEAESMASCVPGTRSLGVLLREPAPEAPEEIVSHELGAAPDVAPSPREESHEITVSPEQDSAEVMAAEPTEEPAEAPEVEEPVVQPAAVEQPPEPVFEKRPSFEPAETAQIKSSAGDSAGSALSVAGTRRTQRGRSSRLPRVVFILALAACALIFWWIADGEERFARRPEQVAIVGAESETVQEPREDSAESLTDPLGEADVDVPVEDSAEVRLQPEAETDTAQNEEAVFDGEIRGPGGIYRIMVSSHYHQLSASLESSELAENGVDTEVVEADLGERGTWYRVVVSGGYPTLSRATSDLDIIKTFGYEGAWIERAPRTE